MPKNDTKPYMEILTKKETVTDHATTGAAARRTRTSSKLSLRLVAKHMGISAPYLSDLERGRRNWNEELAGKFVEAVIAGKLDVF